MRYLALVAALAATAASAQEGAQQAKPPVAAKKPHVVKAPFGAARTDDYYWLRDDSRKNPEMLAYLTAENAYADAVIAPVKPLEEALFRETVARIKQDDSSVPYRKHGYWYYTRFETGADYAIIARRKGSMDAPEEVLFDQPALAKGHGFFQIGDWAVSPDGTKVAWAEDTVGRRQYVLKVKDIATGTVAAETVTNVEPNLVWSGDGASIFYVGKDATTLRSDKVLRHRLGQPASADTLVYTEKDESFYTGIGHTADEKYVCIAVQSTVMTEQRCAPAAAPDAFTVIAPRQRDVLYQSDHIGDRWLLQTNEGGAKNYKIMAKADGASVWSALVPASPTTFIEGMKPFDGFLAIEERSGGNKRMRLLKADGTSVPVAADEPAFTMDFGTNEEAGTDWLRYTYSSLVTPTTTYEVNARTGERRVLKVQPVPGYDAAKYETARVWATARDGTKVPVSLFYARGTPRDGTAPLFQYAYGSYGASTDPNFSVSYPSLADRGVVVAIAHIRGGQEMGRDWYDQGHLANKMNSFTDFIDVTRYLVKEKYAAPGRVAAMGGSAGGLLMGGIANMAPKDYRVIVAQVPFVDVLTTMLDASIPLTTNEYDEWGNPAEQKWYDVMAKYSPYDNVSAQAYPALYVGTGLWDSQVQYYEPAKWVAKLRATATGTAPLVFRTNMEAGHGGKSGRFERYRQNAEAQAFLLGQLGVK
jgi:oligopeptidase B